MSIHPSKIFQVGYADFCAIWRIDDPMNWEPPFVVREAGVFIPPPSPALIRQLTPAELGRVSHPTGSPDEAVLPFPCSLEEMMDWERDKVGEFGNEALVMWMRGRVEQHSHSIEDSSLLFQITREDAIRLLPHVDPFQPFPSFPCSIEALLEWCDDDAGERPWIDPPSNESVVRLIKGRVIPLALAEGPTLRALNTRERNNLKKIVLGLGGVASQTNQPDWEELSRDELYRLIDTACARASFSLDKGSIAGIERQLEIAREKGWIEDPVPKEKLLRSIVKAVRAASEQPKR